jgi:protein-S-isoprenylcysteine O-methyltransferase Ste14
LALKSRRAWVIAYVVTSAVAWSGGFALIARRSPDLIRERMKPGPGAREGCAEETALYALPALAHWVLAAVDRPKRPMPAALQALGLLMYLAANGLVIWAEVENPFFSSAVRIQSERGQSVISTGPYAFIRHPGYAAGAAFAISSALALGSRLALLPAVFFSVALIRRARMEDAFLRTNLPGYEGYAERVRYRLLPGVW